LSDDSHGVSQVGLNYLRMRVYLSSMGVEEIWYLVPIERRQNGDQVIGTRGRVVARRLEGDWRTYPFWSRIAAAQAYNRA
jgi:histidinol-phosphatase (PHP family)